MHSIIIATFIVSHVSKYIMLTMLHWVPCGSSHCHLNMMSAIHLPESKHLVLATKYLDKIEKLSKLLSSVNVGLKSLTYCQNNHHGNMPM